MTDFKADELTLEQRLKAAVWMVGNNDTAEDTNNQMWVILYFLVS